MNMTSEFRFDLPVPDKKPGAYEWWYFDAMSRDQKWQLVVIYYDGCPFSPAYHKNIKENTPSQHPAISVSLYFLGEPVFYSMTEYPPDSCRFDAQGDDRIEIEIGPNRLLLSCDEAQLRHTLELNERFPSGDALEGTIEFESGVPSGQIFNSGAQQNHAHNWNLTQPRARVTAELKYFDPKNSKYSPREIEWDGVGYHDHNIGMEPMEHEFTDWYWGRFHFKETTLVYYLMRTGREKNYQAWVLDKNGKVLENTASGRMEDFRSNLFLLRCGRKITMETDQSEITIQQSKVIDSGPFYYRFRSEAMVHLPQYSLIEQGKGITEYIRPGRIPARIYRPLVHMRYRYFEKPHWVHKSPLMYRWTW